VSRAFEVLASRFSDCAAYQVDLLAAGASGDLAYTVAYERVTASIENAPNSYTLRVTQIYRREDGDWKLVHRHGDEVAQNQTREAAKSLAVDSETLAPDVVRGG
jgi:ketosteroid isomerase-like protein